METNLHYTNKQLAYNINMKKKNNMKKITTRVLNLVDYFKCYKVITRTIISKKKMMKNKCNQTNISHPNPTCQTSHVPNIPPLKLPKHPTSWKSHILNIPHSKHKDYSGTIIFIWLLQRNSNFIIHFIKFSNLTLMENIWNSINVLLFHKFLLTSL